jgi:hypothetical protein
MRAIVSNSNLLSQETADRPFLQSSSSNNAKSRRSHSRGQGNATCVMLIIFRIVLGAIHVEKLEAIH